MYKIALRENKLDTAPPQPHSSSPCICIVYYYIWEAVRAALLYLSAGDNKRFFYPLVQNKILLLLLLLLVRVCGALSENRTEGENDSGRKRGGRGRARPLLLLLCLQPKTAARRKCHQSLPLAPFLTQQSFGMRQGGVPSSSIVYSLVIMCSGHG